MHFPVYIGMAHVTWNPSFLTCNTNFCFAKSVVSLCRYTIYTIYTIIEILLYTYIVSIYDIMLNAAVLNEEHHVLGHHDLVGLLHAVEGSCHLTLGEGCLCMQ